MEANGTVNRMSNLLYLYLAYSHKYFSLDGTLKTLNKSLKGVGSVLFFDNDCDCETWTMSEVCLTIYDCEY